MTSIGTLVAFMIVSIGLIVLRVREPDLPRGSRVPGYPVTPAGSSSTGSSGTVSLRSTTSRLLHSSPIPVALAEWSEQVRPSGGAALAQVADPPVAPADLEAVIGSSSVGPIARVFLGSRASKIVRHSPVPVVLVPRDAPPSSRRRRCRSRREPFV